MGCISAKETKSIMPGDVNHSSCASLSPSTTEKNAKSSPLFDRNNINIESHQTIWLRPNISNENQTINKLRAIIDYVK